MTTVITRDPRSGEAEQQAAELPERTLPHFDSAVAVLLLGTVLAAGGFFLPTSIRWIMWPLAMSVPGHAVVSATFGPSLDFGGFRRAGLSSALTLVTYPLIALSALIIGLRLTPAVVSVGTFLLCALCAAVIARRDQQHRRRGTSARPEPEAPAPRRGLRLQLTEVLIPAGAIFGAMLIAWGSVHVLPRKAPDEFNAIALDGTWALTSRAVPANPSRDTEVTYRIENRTTRVQEYVITAGVVDGPQWSGATTRIEPGDAWVGVTTGRALEDSCRARLEIDMRVVGDQEDHFPLAVFLRDSTIDC